VAISVGLLAATAAAFLLPWPRLPGWLTVLVPLAYTGSVLALLLAAGPTSGVGVVLLVPLVWTALFHRTWESGCVHDRNRRLARSGPGRARRGSRRASAPGRPGQRDPGR